MGSILASLLMVEPRRCLLYRTTAGGVIPLVIDTSSQCRDLERWSIVERLHAVPILEFRDLSPRVAMPCSRADGTRGWY